LGSVGAHMASSANQQFQVAFLGNQINLPVSQVLSRWSFQQPSPHGVGPRNVLLSQNGHGTGQSPDAGQTSMLGNVLPATLASAAVAALAALQTRSRRRHWHQRHQQITPRAVASTEVKKAAIKHKSGRQPKVIVLGSGWGAMTFIQGLSEEEAQMYDITVVSPRNHFLYTPLLPTACMGTTEERSIVTPVREMILGKADFLEAQCEHIDVNAKLITCKCSDAADFQLAYDILVYAVGAQTNDFGCPGVREHAFFFKEVADSQKVRERVVRNFEKASLPSTTAEERAALLSFVIVGGGPTGVEVAADLADFVQGEGKKLYPKIIDQAKVQLISTGADLLATYNQEISKKSFEVLTEEGVEVLRGCRVVEVKSDSVAMRRKGDGEGMEVKSKCVVWAAGIKENPLSTQLKAALIEKNEHRLTEDMRRVQASTRGIVTDEWLQVRGSEGSIFALGDACAVQQELASVHADELFEKGDADGNQELDVNELQQLFEMVSAEYPHVQEYTRYLRQVSSAPNDDPRIASVARVFQQAADDEERAWVSAFELFQQRVSGRRVKKEGSDVEADIRKVDVNENQLLDLDEFKELLRSIDSNLRTFPATAQVAAQQGKHLAKVFSKGRVSGQKEDIEEALSECSRFTYFHKGSLAYLGAGSAAFDVPVVGAITGRVAGLAWKVYETTAQLSWKSKALVALDWVRTGIFGRDSSLF